MSEQQIAWIGLGNMGRGMAKNLVEKGNLAKPLIIFNRTRARADKLADAIGKDKVKVVDAVQDAVSQADIVFTCVGDDAAIEETFKAATEVDVKGKLFVECSTVLPDCTEGLAKLVKGKGAEFVASPVFGAPPMADAGMLLFVLAGPKEAVQRVIPFTKGVMGKAHIDLTDKSYGQASTLKIIGNSFVMSMVEGLAEGLALSEKTGLGTEAYAEFIEALFPGPAAAYAKRMTSGDYHKREEPLFAIDLARKDAGHMLNLANKHGAKLGNIENIDKHFQTVQKEMGSKGDMAGVYGATRVEAGLPFKN